MDIHKKRAPASQKGAALTGYDHVLGGVIELLESARRVAARSVNAVMTATYWEIGRRIVEFEQMGEDRAEYGIVLVTRLAADLARRFGRGFSKSNLYQMRGIYLAYPQIFQTPSGKLETTIFQTLSGKSNSTRNAVAVSAHSDASLTDLAHRFPLPWSHYVLLLKVDKPEAREFYQAEALRNGWTVRQLERQFTTLFYERTLASRNKGAMLKKGAVAKPGDEVSVEQEIKDPLFLEFLGLKDEYSESDLEEALTGELESFLLELGGDFAFVGRQKRLRIDDEWYRIDCYSFTASSAA